MAKTKASIVTREDVGTALKRSSKMRGYVLNRRQVLRSEYRDLADTCEIFVRLLERALSFVEMEGPGESELESDVKRILSEYKSKEPTNVNTK